MSADPRLIVALDVPTRAEAERLVRSVDDAVSFYKIGLQLFAGDGMALARDLKAAGKSVFLDWKLHDIGATVEKAAAAVVASGACDLLTVHAEPQVLAAAVRYEGGDAMPAAASLAQHRQTETSVREDCEALRQELARTASALLDSKVQVERLVDLLATERSATERARGEADVARAALLHFEGHRAPQRKNKPAK